MRIPTISSFIDDTRPEGCRSAFTAHFWELAWHAVWGRLSRASSGPRPPASAESGSRGLNAELHRRGVKVIGHMNVKFLVGDPESPEGPRGFFRFYRDQWDEKLLGPKPVSDPLDLLEKDKFGKPISSQTYNIGGMREYWACLNNPQWRQVLKAWTRFGIAQGVDGFIANYFYRHDCHCAHCVIAFRQYLRERFTAEELKERFAIADLKHTNLMSRELARPVAINTATARDAALFADRQQTGLRRGVLAIRTIDQTGSDRRAVESPG